MDDPGWRLRHLPVLVGASGVLMLLAAGIGLLVAGRDGALGAALGVGVASASFTISTVLVAWADSVNPQLVLTVGLATYVTKTVLLGIFMLIVIQAGWAGQVPLGWGVALGVVGWTGVHIVWLARRRPWEGTVGDRSSPRAGSEE
jgi:hypothetical protein